jgi:asparagine synthetase B (glutamine-hydrolysing)
MFGIFGILPAPNKTDPRRLAAIEAVTASLGHRGSDDRSMWMDRVAGVALEHPATGIAR